MWSGSQCKMVNLGSNPLLLLANMGNTSYPDNPDWNSYNFGRNATIRLIIHNYFPAPTRYVKPCYSPPKFRMVISGYDADHYRCIYTAIISGFIRRTGGLGWYGHQSIEPPTKGSSNPSARVL